MNPDLTPVLTAAALAAAVVLGLWLRNRRLKRQRNASRSLAEQWESIAARAQQERDHLAERLRYSRAQLAEVISDRDKAVRVLLSRIERLEHDGQAAVGVALERVAVVTGQLAEVALERVADLTAQLADQAAPAVAPPDACGFCGKPMPFAAQRDHFIEDHGVDPSELLSMVPVPTLKAEQ